MATTYTDNLNLQQPDLDDDALITVINNDMAIIDKAVNGVQDGLAIVANGNTHVAISAGQFVYVRNHTTLTEGLYVASSNIAANATLSTSNLTADSAGGLNALNSNITTLNEQIANPVSATVKVDNVDKIFFHRIGTFVVCVIAGYPTPQTDLGVIIPSGFRPSVNSAFTGLLYYYTDDNYIATCNANTNGKLLVRRKNTISTRDEDVNNDGHNALYASTIWTTA